MAYSSHYDRDLDIVRAERLSRARRASRAVGVAYPNAIWSDLIEIEFSNFGRNPHYPRGWYMAPAMLMLLLLAPLAI
ncbi:MAG: hypothetical protein ACREFW_03360 [Rhizomicrobium sp.]